MSHDDLFPTLGLGVGIWPSQLSSDLVHHRGVFDFVELYDADLAVDGVRDRIGGDVALLLHSSGLSPASASSVPADLLDRTRSAADALGAPWVVEDIAVWRSAGPAPVLDPYFPVVFDEATLALLASRIGPLCRALGRPFVCEFPPLDVVLGTISPPEFFCRLANATDALFALDVSHWVKYAQLVGADPADVLGAFPLDRVIELHLSGGNVLPGPAWYDEEHSTDLVQACVELLGLALARAPRIRAVTLECHAAPAEVILRSLERVEMLSEIRDLRARKTVARARASRGVGAIEPANVPWMAEREKVVAELFVDPVKLVAVRDGRLDMGDQARRIARAVTDEGVQSLGVRFCRRALELEPLIATLAAREPLAFFAAVTAYVRGPGLREGPSLESFTAFVSAHAMLPAWARDVLRFRLDTISFEAGPGEERSATYGYPVIATARALAAGVALPSERSTRVLFRRGARGMTVEERATPALPRDDAPLDVQSLS